MQHYYRELSEASWQIALYPDGHFTITHQYANGSEVCSGWTGANTDEGFIFPMIDAGGALPDSTTYLVATGLGDYNPPEISVAAFPDVEVGYNDDYLIQALVQDDAPLDGVWLIWMDNLENADSLAMTPGEGGNWTAVIPQHENPGWIQYCVTARDASEHQNQTSSPWQNFLVQEVEAPLELQVYEELNGRLPLCWQEGATNHWAGDFFASFEGGIPEGWLFMNGVHSGTSWRLVPAYHMSYESGALSNMALQAYEDEEGEGDWLITPAFQMTDQSSVEFDFGMVGYYYFITHRLEIGVVTGDAELFDGSVQFTFYCTDSETDMQHYSIAHLLHEWLGQEIRLAFKVRAGDHPVFPVFLDNIEIHSIPDPGSREFSHYEILRNEELVGTSDNCSWCDTSPLLDSASYKVRACYSTDSSAFSEVVTAQTAARPTRGGPDAEGYTWIHSDDDEGPEWDWWPDGWTDLSLSGGFSATLELGFDFPFYGIPYNHFRVSSSGAVEFAFSNYSHLFLPIPDTYFPNAFISAMIGVSQQARAGYALHEDRMRVEFRDTNDHPLCQLELVVDGTITWYFRDTAESSLFLVGQENEDGSAGLSIRFLEEGARIGEGVAIRSQPDPNLDCFPPVIEDLIIPDQCAEDSLLEIRLSIVDLDHEVDEARLFISGGNQRWNEYPLLPLGDDQWGTVLPLHDRYGCIVYKFCATDNTETHNSGCTQYRDFIISAVNDTLQPSASRNLQGRIHVSASNPAWESRNQLGYRLRRNGLLLEDCLPVPSYDDVSVFPFVEYHYSFSAVYASGEGASSPLKAGQCVNNTGPDAYGYRCITSDNENGPDYNWIEISECGVEIPLDDNRYAGPLELGFQFPYYGESFDQIYIHRFGYLFFNDPDAFYGTYYGQRVPDSMAPNGVIAAYWDNLDPSRGGEVYAWLDRPNNRYIVEYHELLSYSGAPIPQSFELILYPDGSIITQYQYVKSTCNAVAGIESPDGRHGILYCYGNSNYSSLHDEMSLCYTPGQFPVEDCTGHQETEPNQGWQSDPPTWSEWNGDSLLCGNLLDDECDCFLLGTGSSMALRATLTAPELDARLCVRSLQSGLWEFTADSNKVGGCEVLQIEGLPGPFYLCVEGHSADDGLAQYVIHVEWRDMPAPCDTAVDLGLMQEELLLDRVSPTSNCFNIHLIDTALTSAGTQEWFHFIAGRSESLAIQMHAEGIGNEILALFSSCDDPASQLLAVMDENGYGHESETLSYDLEEGEEYWVLAGFTETGHSQEYSLSFEWTTAVNKNLLPLSFTLQSVSPNPFNPVTHIRWLQPMAGEVQLRVWNLGGQLVDVIRPGTFAAGEHQLAWDGSTRASGLYFYRLEAPGGAATGRMLLLK